MKRIFLFAVASILMIAGSCNAQPKSDYEIYGNTVNGTTKYHFFLEKKSASAYKLVQGMDYLAPSVLSLKVGEASVPIFTVSLNNDASEYTVGVVAENSAGFYSGMGVGLGTVGLVPSIPANAGLRKK